MLDRAKEGRTPDANELAVAAVRVRVMSKRLEVLFDETIERGLVTETGVLVNNFAVLEDDDGRNAADAELGGDFVGFVAVVLDDLSTAVKGFSSLFEARGEHAAGAAPGSPEVNENRQFGLDDGGFEVGVVDVKNFAHDISMRYWLEITVGAALVQAGRQDLKF